MILGLMMSNESLPSLPQEIDNVVVKTFVEKFNVKYDSELLGEQKQLLSYYISSFTDNALALKVFLNEEIGRLKSELEAAKNLDEIKNDSEMVSKTDEVIDTLQTYAQQAISEDLLLTVLKTQSLVKEIHSDGRSS